LDQQTSDDFSCVPANFCYLSRLSQKMEKLERGAPRSLTLWPLVAATYFMVSGGPYGTEDIVHGAGYGGAVLVLFLTPIFWSLPVALMVGELSSAIPAEGGFYVWVKRALGPFWGFQEAWLSLAASAFDMAIYPTLFVIYLSELLPALKVGHRGVLLGLFMIAACALWNIAGAKAVGDSSLWLFLALLSPFIVLSFWVLAHSSQAAYSSVTLGRKDLIGAVLVAMWNYMGWDNASTIAGEVENPQRTYPLAMTLGVAIVALSYAIPIAAMSRSGIAPGVWETGAWADLAGRVVAPWLKTAIVIGGAISSFGMFNSLVMSYSRLPLVLAEDGYLPRAFTSITKSTGAPWVAVIFCAIGWAACLGIGFERLVTLDILLYGGSLLLEFAALIALRITAPELDRPYRVPLGSAGPWIVTAGPALMIVLAVLYSGREQIAGMNAFVFGALIMLLGMLLYPALRFMRPTVIAAKQLREE
jgi:amino acid transporter